MSYELLVTPYTILIELATVLSSRFVPCPSCPYCGKPYPDFGQNAVNSPLQDAPSRSPQNLHWGQRTARCFPS